jgi:hypothetical protein
MKRVRNTIRKVRGEGPLYASENSVCLKCFCGKTSDQDATGIPCHRSKDATNEDLRGVKI